MSKVYDRPIIIQTVDEITERWTNLYTLHASVNKTKEDNEYLSAGAVQDKRALTFEVRYFSNLEAIANNTQMYRIIFGGTTYDVKDYDDYMLKHKTVRLLGVSI